jgi:hypothetical protein
MARFSGNSDRYLFIGGEEEQHFSAFETVPLDSFRFGS